MRLRPMTWTRQAMTVALAVLVVAIGLCLFDGDASGADGGLYPDFCTGGALVSAAPVLLGLTVIARLEERRLELVDTASSRQLDPPPRSFSQPS